MSLLFTARAHVSAEGEKLVPQRLLGNLPLLVWMG